jgi:hypothetical protein
MRFAKGQGMQQIKSRTRFIALEKSCALAAIATFWASQSLRSRYVHAQSPFRFLHQPTRPKATIALWLRT